MKIQELIDAIGNAYREAADEHPHPGKWLDLTDRQRDMHIRAHQSLLHSKLYDLYGRLKVTKKRFEEAHNRARAIREIKHAFDDASVNMFSESEEENRREYREMLEMHTNITQEHYGFSDRVLKKLVVAVATEIGAKEAYDWAYGIA